MGKQKKIRVKILNILFSRKHKISVSKLIKKIRAGERGIEPKFIKKILKELENDTLIEFSSDKKRVRVRGKTPAKLLRNWNIYD